MYTYIYICHVFVCLYTCTCICVYAYIYMYVCIIWALRVAGERISSRIRGVVRPCVSHTCADGVVVGRQAVA